VAGTGYWTSSAPVNGFNVPEYFYGGGSLNEGAAKHFTRCSRAFRCVSY
jgi:hypothetical protein